MKEKSSKYSENLSYVIDGDFHIVYYNDVMEQNYKELQCGRHCYEAFMDMDEPCSNCPIGNHLDEEVYVYHKVTNLWLNARSAAIQWPGIGKCSIVIANKTENCIQDAITRIPFMAGYDLVMEMNLTKDTYHQIVREGNEGKQSNEMHDIRKLVQNVSEKLVHPDDKSAFVEFWDFDTVLMRIHEAGDVFHGEFREKNASGEWDIVRIVLLPAKNSKAVSDDIIIAFYTIIKKAVSKDKQLEENNKTVLDALTGLPSGKSVQEQVLKFRI